MSQARTNARRRRQAANGFAHMSGSLRRPKYKMRQLLNVAAAIELERTRAARLAKIKR